MELTKNEIDIIKRFSIALLHSIDAESKMKTDQTKEGYYPYIPNTDITSLVIGMLKYKLNSLADLGCGEGHILHLLKLLRFKVMGVEVYEDYIKVAKRLLSSTVNIVHKDIFDIKPNEIKIHNSSFEFRRGSGHWEIPDILYFYEPVFSKELAFDFIDRIMYLVRPGQFIFHKSASANMTAKLQTYVDKGQLLQIERGYLDIYKKPKHKRIRS
jgi:SAM-dependent methyltransferase